MRKSRHRLSARIPRYTEGIDSGDLGFNGVQSFPKPVPFSGPLLHHEAQLERAALTDCVRA
jgi:hypothetical protein